MNRDERNLPHVLRDSPCNAAYATAEQTRSGIYLGDAEPKHAPG